MLIVSIPEVLFSAVLVDAPVEAFEELRERECHARHRVEWHVGTQRVRELPDARSLAEHIHRLAFYVINTDRNQHTVARRRNAGNTEVRRLQMPVPPPVDAVVIRAMTSITAMA